MIKKILLIFSILIFSFVNYITYATDEIISSQMDALNIPSFIKEGEKYTKEVFPDISLNDFLSSAIKGEIDNKGLLKQIILLFGDEIVDVIYLLGSIIVVIIIHSILKAFTENLENDENLKNIAKHFIITNKAEPYIFTMLATKPSPYDLKFLYEQKVKQYGNYFFEYDKLLIEDITKEKTIVVVTKGREDIVESLENLNFSKEETNLYCIMKNF